jgi:hypothetical protein
MNQYSDLYFIVNPALGIIKIGIAGDVTGRRISLEHACGVPLEVLRVVKGGERYEKPLHEAFGRSRLRGEWFLPTDSLVRLATGTADIGEYLTRAEPETAKWRKERDAKIAAKKAEDEAANRAHKEEVARLLAEEKALKAKRAEKTAKARAANVERNRKAQEQAAAKAEEQRLAWVQRDGSTLKRITTPEAMQLADRRRTGFAQRMRNATLIGLTPEA